MRRPASEAMLPQEPARARGSGAAGLARRCKRGRVLTWGVGKMCRLECWQRPVPPCRRSWRAWPRASRRSRRSLSRPSPTRSPPPGPTCSRMPPARRRPRRRTTPPHTQPLTPSSPVLHPRTPDSRPPVHPALPSSPRRGATPSFVPTRAAYAAVAPPVRACGRDGVGRRPPTRGRRVKLLKARVPRTEKRAQRRDGGCSSCAGDV